MKPWKRQRDGSYLRMLSANDARWSARVWPAQRVGKRSDRIYVWVSWCGAVFSEGCTFTLSRAQQHAEKTFSRPQPAPVSQSTPGDSEGGGK